MSSQAARTDVVLERLRQTLAPLGASGLPRPGAFSFVEYVRTLADEQVLPQDVTNRLINLYHACRYGSEALDNEAVDASDQEVGEAIVAWQHRSQGDRAAVVARWKSRCEQSDRNLSNARRDGRSAVGETEQVAQPKDDFNAPSPAEDGWNVAKRRAGKPSRGRRRGWIVAGIAVWTLAVVIVVYVEHDTLSSLVHSPAVRSRLGLKVDESDEATLALLHEEAEPRHRGQKPVGLLAQLAGEHWQRGNHAEAIGFFRQALARKPESPELLNNLAWLLLTVEDPAHRDPIQALELAEKGHRLQPAPHIKDTLAEACFQVGDIQRAVALEREALRANPLDRGTYQRRLKKF